MIMIALNYIPVSFEIVFAHRVENVDDEKEKRRTI